MYGDINNKRVKHNPAELRAQSGDQAHHGRNLKYKCERVHRKKYGMYNTETENKGNMNEGRRTNGNAWERMGMV